MLGRGVLSGRLEPRGLACMTRWLLIGLWRLNAGLFFQLCRVAGTGCLSGTSVRPHIFVGGEPGNRGNKIPPLPFDVHRLFFAIALIQDTETATEIKKERRRDKHVA